MPHNKKNNQNSLSVLADSFSGDMGCYDNRYFSTKSMRQFKKRYCTHFLQYRRYQGCNSSDVTLNAKGTRKMAAAATALPRLPKKKNGNSHVWKYFADDQGLIIDSQKTILKRCQRAFQMKGGNTSNLRKQLKDRHPDLFKEFKVSFKSC